MPYDEHSIHILSDRESTDRFDWLREAKLAQDNHLPVEWVKRGFEASRRLGIEPDYFIDRYIHKKDVAPHPDFEAVFVEIMREARQ